MNRVIRFFWALSLCLVSVLPAVAAPANHVNLATGTGPVDFLFQIADEKGFFVDHGVDVSLHTYKRGMECVSKGILKDSMDGAIISTFVMAIKSFDHPHLLSIVTKIGISDTLDKIIVRPESRVVSPRDLVGKRIAVPRGGTSHYFLVTYLEKWNLSPENVTVVFMKKKDMPRAILNGDVDAVCQHEPVLGKIRKILQGKGVELGEDALARKTAVLSIRNDFAAEHPELVRGILLGVFDALKFFEKNRDESEEIFARRKKLSLKEVRNFLGHDFTVHLSMPQSLLISLEQATLWALHSGIVDSQDVAPSSLDLVDYTFMESIKPEAVTIIH